MNNHAFTFCGAALNALGSGALWWPDQSVLCVSDLHLGKSERMARRGGSILPPYEIIDTLTRLQTDLDATNPQTVICLGDSFDDLGAALALPEDAALWITRLQAGRSWIWIEGNHDPGPIDLGGSHLAEYTNGPLTFRHIAEHRAQGEISGHYHPKTSLPLRGRTVTGLRSGSEVLRDLMQEGTFAILTGPVPVAVPLPR